MTELLYFSDTYSFQSIAKITKTDEVENKTFVVLDQTIFYPQGGGQPSDVGFIFNHKARFRVERCVFDDDDVLHFGHFETEQRFNLGDEVSLEIDAEKRKLNSRNHSAGHLIDLAINQLFPNLQAIKGYHFADGPYVEYLGKLENNAETLAKIENLANQIILKNPKISFTLENSKHESGKAMRIMQIEGFEDCPCGGTHVKELAQIGQLKIRKIKQNGENVRISYAI